MKKLNTLCKSTTTLDLQTVILVLSYLNIWKVYLLVYIVVFILFSCFVLASWAKLNSENLSRKTILTK